MACVWEAMNSANALLERNRQATSPSTRSERRCILVRLFVGLGVEFCLLRFWVGEFFHGDCEFDLSLRLFFRDRKMVKLGELIRRFPCDMLPVGHRALPPELWMNTV